ncbi:hypothetical protein M0R19_05670 [Candidatus Pacearchaeota archaeon]|nr:hypothetical protein [Candidatus Pacearchaeota archaeon]
MKPIIFKQQNCTFAENQPEYLPLPAYKSDDGEVISCWELSLLERVQILFTGKLWLRILTFNKHLQPQLPTVKSPF